MKRIPFLLLVIFVSSLSLFSCDVEPIDPAVLTEVPQDPSDPNNPGNPDEGETTGDYWPAALNNTWTFDGTQGEYDMKIVSINSINGYTYYTFNPQNGAGQSTSGTTSTMRMRKSGGAYYLKADSFEIDMGIMTATMSELEILVLKDNVAVGETWTQNLEQTTTYSDPIMPTVTTTIALTGTIEEKDATVTVNGQSYSNVIKSKVTQVASMMGMPATTAVSYYYFSKDVGPIKIDHNGTSTSELTTYDLN